MVCFEDLMVQSKQDIKDMFYFQLKESNFFDDDYSVGWAVTFYMYDMPSEIYISVNAFVERTFGAGVNPMTLEVKPFRIPLILDNVMSEVFFGFKLFLSVLILGTVFNTVCCKKSGADRYSA